MQSAAEQTADRTVLNETNAIHTWDLADYSDYTTFQVNADKDTNQVFLYGCAKDGEPIEELDCVAVQRGDRLVIHSDNTARKVEFTYEALWEFSEIVYIGGKTKNDTITLNGTDSQDNFEMSQETFLADVHERPGKTKTQEVVFETVTTSLSFTSCATVKMSGIRLVTIDSKEAQGYARHDWFRFVKFGTTYDLIGGDKEGDGPDFLTFSEATSAVKLDMGKTTAQSVLAGQKGKLCLHGDIDSISGSCFNDKITTAANVTQINGGGGSDTVTLVGNENTHVSLNLVGGSQKVKGKGSGVFNINIGDLAAMLPGDGTRSTINMSSVKSGSMNLEAYGNNIQVTGTKGDDLIVITGDNAKVQGNDGNDYITIEGVNARVAGGKGNDVIELALSRGKCILDGGDGNDILFGGSGDDVLKARSGSNIMFGNTGADKLTGGRDNDLLIANSTSKIGTTEVDFNKLLELWSAGMAKEVVEMLGEASVADHEKDTLKRGGGIGNLFYANTNLLGNDLDSVDYKLDKGDILLTDLDG